MKKLPQKRYKVIYVDPPWKYKDQGKSGKRGASQQYQTMTLDQMIEIPIETIAKNDAVMFMWFTDTHILEAYALARAWGFEPKRIGFVWVKVTKDFEKQRIMLGRYTRSNAEFVMIATRGQIPKRKSNSVRSIVFAVPGKHSVKPDEVRKRITKLYGNVSRIELFARKRKHLNDGWDYWGNQA